MINARAETAAEKPAFRSAIRRRRCLVPASGFYEWKRTNGRKQPYFIRMRVGKVFAFAGLWESWKEPGGAAVESWRDYDLWLSPADQDPRELAFLFRPYPLKEMIAFPVGTAVNNPKADAPALIEPLER